MVTAIVAVGPASDHSTLVWRVYTRERLEHAKRYYGAIREVLLRDWDPLGVPGNSLARNECDGHVYIIYGMLIRQKPRGLLVDLLRWLGTSHKSLRGDRQRTKVIVDRLNPLREQPEADA